MFANSQHDTIYQCKYLLEMNDFLGYIFYGSTIGVHEVIVLHFNMQEKYIIEYTYGKCHVFRRMVNLLTIV